MKRWEYDSFKNDNDSLRDNNSLREVRGPDVSCWMSVDHGETGRIAVVAGNWHMIMMSKFVVEFLA